MNAYFVTCTGFEKDADGNVTVVHCTYDPETKSGSGFNARKVKGTIHWVAAQTALKAEVRLYENLVDEEKGKLNADGTLNLNPNSLRVLKECYLEPGLKEAKAFESFQFVRNGYFCVDCRDSEPGQTGFQPDCFAEELFQASEINREQLLKMYKKIQKKAALF